MTVMKTKKTNKRGRKTGRNAAPCSAIPFENNQGARLLIPDSLTLKDLAKMGVSQIRIESKGSPLPNGWWRDCV